MAEHKEDNQALLFAATGSFWGILAVQGDLARCEAVECGNMEDLGFSKSALPTQPGLYVWEGSIWLETGGWCGSEPIDPDTDYQGKWRPAFVADLEQFGWGCFTTLLFPPLTCPSEDEVPGFCAGFLLE